MRAPFNKVPVGEDVTVTLEGHHPWQTETMYMYQADSPTRILAGRVDPTCVTVAEGSTAGTVVPAAVTVTPAHAAPRCTRAHGKAGGKCTRPLLLAK